MRVELHHTSDGREGAPVLVLGSSLGTTGAMWDENVPALAERFRVIRYDTRGHGRSPAPDGPYGAKGIGEGPVCGAAAAVANAIADATGVRFHELPMTAPRIWRGLQSDEA